MQAFDPDVIVHKPVFVSDLDDEALSKRVDLTTTDDPKSRIAELRTSFAGVALRSLDEDWLAGIHRWCAARSPHELLGDASLPVEASEVNDPFTPTAVAAGGAAQATSFVVDQLDPALALMVASRAGVNPDGRSCAALVPAEEDLSGLAEWAVTGAVLRGRLPCVDERAWETGPAAARATAMLDALPLPSTQVGLDWLFPAMFRRAPFLLVIGDEASDHALAVLADRMLPGAAWVPAHLLKADNSTGDAVRIAAASFIHSSRVGRAATHPLLVTSLSLSMDETADLVQSIGGYMSGDAVVMPPEEIPFDHVRFLADPQAASIGSTHPITDHHGTVTMLTEVNPPVPSAFSAGNEGTWMVDVRFGRGVLCPPRRAIRSSLLAGDNQSLIPETSIRTSRRGLTYWSQVQTIVVSGALPGANYARPLLRFPGAAESVRDLAHAVGLTARPSVVGARAQRVAEMWGSHVTLASDLAGPTGGLLRTLAKRVANGPLQWGCGVNRRCHVTLAGAQTLLGSTEADARLTLDRLLLTRVVRRGLLLGCERCSSVEFYLLADLHEEFRCIRCRADNPLVQARWRDPFGEPAWFYDLDPLVMDFLDQNGDVPVMAAAEIRRRHDEPSSTTFEIEFSHKDESDPWIEIDFACVVAGRLYIGEAKSNGDLKGNRGASENARRLAKLATELTADHLVLATTRSTWKDGQVDLVRAEAEAAARACGGRAPSVEAISLAV